MNDVDEMEGKPAGNGRMLRPVAVAILLFACVVGVKLAHVERLFGADSLQRMREWLSEKGALGPLWFTLAATALIAVGVPRVFCAAVAGLAFGAMRGSLFATVATVAGCWITFAISRGAARPLAERLLSRRFRAVDKVMRRIGEHGFEMNLFLRALPIGNAFLTNILLGLSTISTVAFLLGTMLGTLPLTILYASIGDTLHRPSIETVLIASGALVALALLLYFVRRHRMQSELSRG